MSRTRIACRGRAAGHPTAWLLVALAVLACSSNSSAADANSTSPRSASGKLVDVPAGEWPPLKADLFQSGKDGYTCYRIPAMVVTKRGVVLVFCAARKGGGGDWDPINIAMRRSTDNGRTWEPRRILLDQGPATVDNPTPIVDRQSGAVHFLYQVNYARCYYMRSDDDGQTFSRRWTSRPSSSSSARSTNGT